MLGRSKKLFLFKLLSLLSVVRGYNILIIILAQYLASIFILAPDKPKMDVLLDLNLFIIVLATAAVVASGYIINNFYDNEKDLINRPRKTQLDRVIRQQTRLTGYFIINFFAVILASAVSFKAVVFFSGFIFVIWLYSHKLKKILFIGNAVAAVLAITPFFGVFVYYRNLELVIFVHAAFLFLLLFIRELIKDLSSLQGDLVLNYNTIPVVFGERTAKFIIAFLVPIAAIPVGLLITHFEVGLMDWYFFAVLVFLIVFSISLWWANSKKAYVRLHIVLKFIIVSGVFSILLMDPAVLKRASLIIR